VPRDRSYWAVMTEIAASAPRTIAPRRWLLILAALCCAGLLAWWLSRPAGMGPLALPGNGSSRVGAPVLPGQWLVSSIVTARLTGSTPAVIDSVRPADPSQAAGLVLRYAVMPDDNHMLPGSARGWPPAGYPLTQVHGFVVRPGRELRLIVGIATRRLGTYRIDAFDVTYRVFGHQYTATFRQGIQLHSTPDCSLCRVKTQLAGRIRG
jgi:hypothetical protein